MMFFFLRPLALLILCATLGISYLFVCVFPPKTFVRVSLINPLLHIISSLEKKEMFVGWVNKIPSVLSPYYAQDEV